MELQNVTMIVLLDLSAAFDTMDHNLMLSIYENRFGITDTALQWYDSYLRRQRMKVYVDGHHSRELSIKYDVPQGSCSGANNFTAYCSPVGDIVPECINLNGCADDHSLRSSLKANNRIKEDQY